MKNCGFEKNKKGQNIELRSRVSKKKKNVFPKKRK